MRVKHFGALSAFLALVGCASGMYGESRTGRCVGGYIDEQRLTAELAAAVPCCSQYSQMFFIPAVADDNHIYVIRKDSPVFLFASGKSRFVAVELPLSQNRNLFVRPWPSGRTSLATSCEDTKAALFVGEGSEWYRAIEPLVTFLDASKHELAVAVPARSSATGDYRHPIPEGARYAVIHTSPERIGVQRRIVPKRMDQTIPLLVGALNVPTPATLAAVVTETGSVSLKYED
jgi:hypothetical protein